MWATAGLPLARFSFTSGFSLHTPVRGFSSSWLNSRTCRWHGQNTQCGFGSNIRQCGLPVPRARKNKSKRGRECNPVLPNMLCTWRGVDVARVVYHVAKLNSTLVRKQASFDVHINTDARFCRHSLDATPSPPSLLKLRFVLSHLPYFGPETVVHEGSETQSFSVSRDRFPRSIVTKTANDGFLWQQQRPRQQRRCKAERRQYLRLVFDPHNPCHATIGHRIKRSIFVRRWRCNCTDG